MKPDRREKKEKQYSRYKTQRVLKQNKSRVSECLGSLSIGIVRSVAGPAVWGSILYNDCATISRLSLEG